MSKLQRILVLLFFLLISSCASFYQRPELLTDKPVDFPHNPITPLLAKTKAFPSAQGYGAFSKGGRGGTAIYVSNLNDDGKGSLRDALQTAEGARNILFNVSGCIELKKNIRVTNPFVTLAGQTAPGDGICLKGGGIVIKTHDVVIRHIRIRRGGHLGEIGRLSDGIAFNRASNSIVDHVSVSWTLDESLQLWHRGTINNTVQNSIFSEPLNSPQLRPDEGHKHGYGPLIGNQSANFTFYRNVVTHSQRRNPRISNSQNIDILNNVFYKFRGAGTYIVDRHDKYQSRFIRVFDNIYKSENKKSALLVRVDPNVSEIAVSGNRFMKMNAYLDTLERLPFQDSYNSDVSRFLIDMQTATNLWSTFDKTVGATLPVRDKVDSAILNSVRNGTGNFVDCVDRSDLQNSVMVPSTCKYESLAGEWPDYQSATPLPDTDNDGMPDFWEKANNLNIHSALDGPSFPNNSVYTNLELYLNEVAAD